MVQNDLKNDVDFDPNNEILSRRNTCQKCFKLFIAVSDGSCSGFGIQFQSETYGEVLARSLGIRWSKVGR